MNDLYIDTCTYKVIVFAAYVDIKLLAYILRVKKTRPGKQPYLYRIYQITYNY